MGLNKYRLGDLLQYEDERNTELNYGIDDVKGISIQKCFIETKADMEGVSLRPYLLVKPDSFAYVTVTSRNGEKITLAHNTTANTYIVSSSYVVFSVKEKTILDSNYLFMYFNRPEFDRYARFNSWGSARETFDWKTMCDITIELPPIEVQKKYAEVYLSMVENQKSYEAGLEDLKLTCDGYIENLKNDISKEPIGEYLILSEKRNDVGLGVEKVRGLAVSKQMIPTKADMDGVSLSNYKIVPPRHIAYVPDTSRRGDKMSLGFNDTDETFLVSSISTVFTTDTNYLLPEYLLLFFCRSEFDRYARFHSWGSARETFDWKTMCEVNIPIPNIEKQKAISEIYQAYTMRKDINEQLKLQIKDICPILIKSSLEELRI